MPPREWRFRIQDILDAIESIRTYTAGLDFATFENDKRTVDAVVRNLIIMGKQQPACRTVRCGPIPASHGPRCGP